MTGEELLRIFPTAMQKRFCAAAKRAEEIQEIHLRVLKPIQLIILGSMKYIADSGEIVNQAGQAAVFQKQDAEAFLQYLCHDSVYAFEEEIKKGYLTIPGGHRIGLAGEVALTESGMVKTIRNISCFNIRIAHEIKGSAMNLLPYLYRSGNPVNTLLISPPGCGKTTMLRDLIRAISNGNQYGQARMVSVIDERSELAGCFRGIAENDIGYHSDVLDGCPKKTGMLMMMRAMAPQVMAVDEIGGWEDAEALLQVIRCGITILVTIHGNSIEEIKGKKFLQEFLQERIFQRYVILARKGDHFTVTHIYDGELQECLK